MSQYHGNAQFDFYEGPRTLEARQQDWTDAVCKRLEARMEAANYLQLNYVSPTERAILVAGFNTLTVFRERPSELSRDTILKFSVATLPPTFDGEIYLPESVHSTSSDLLILHPEETISLKEMSSLAELPDHQGVAFERAIGTFKRLSGGLPSDFILQHTEVSTLHSKADLIHDGGSKMVWLGVGVKHCFKLQTPQGSGWRDVSDQELKDGILGDVTSTVSDSSKQDHVKRQAPDAGK